MNQRSDEKQLEALLKLYNPSENGSVRIGVDHPEHCVHKHNYYQVTHKYLFCDKCSRSGCKFHGLTSV